MAAAKSPDTGVDEKHVLLLILVVGALLRLPGLWQFDAWQDEIYSIFEARDLIHSPFGPGGMELRPLYFLALHPFAKAMPHAMVLLRLPSFIFGMLGIAATWTLAKQHLGRNPAIVAAGVLAVLPLHINASHIIRYWSLVYLLGALFAGALLRAMASDERRDHLLGAHVAARRHAHPSDVRDHRGRHDGGGAPGDQHRHLRLAPAFAGCVAPRLGPGGGAAPGVLRHSLAVLHDGAAGRRSGGVTRSPAAGPRVQPVPGAGDRQRARHRCGCSGAERRACDGSASWPCSAP